MRAFAAFVAVSLHLLCCRPRVVAGAFAVPPTTTTTAFGGAAIRWSASARTPSSSAAHAAAASSTAAPDITVSRLETDEEIMDVAAFRNNFVGYEALVAKQQAKRDAVDKTAAAFKGIQIGLGVGAAAGILSGLSASDPIEGLKTFGAVGGLTGGLLGANNYMGKSVYVMGVDEARNRLKVDFVEGLMARQDVGFAARIDDPAGGKYQGSNGVVACIDCQLRNCASSRNSRAYGSLPPHVHVKNLEVDSGVRRRGIATSLVRAVEEYASETEAELITLIVDDTNAAAIGLYKGLGYEFESIASPLAQQKYGQFMRGRSIGTKQI